MQNSARLPHVSAHLDVDGVARIEVRPPITESMNLLFDAESLGTPPVLHSKMLDSSVGADLVLVDINPHHILQPEWSQGAEARNCGQVVVKDRGGGQRTAHRCYESGNLQSRDVEYVMHGTSIESALEIVKVRGRMSPTEKQDAPGGVGVYGFKVDDISDMKCIMDACAATRSGGYNKGACIIFRTHALVFKSSSRDIIPPGFA